MVHIVYSDHTVSDTVVQGYGQGISTWGRRVHVWFFLERVQVFIDETAGTGNHTFGRYLNEWPSAVCLTYLCGVGAPWTWQTNINIRSPYGGGVPSAQGGGRERASVECVHVEKAKDRRKG